MAQTSRPWQGSTTGDAGPYSSKKWAKIYHTALGFNNNLDNQGPLRGVDSELEVVATSPVSQQVTVQQGGAIVQGRWYYLDADENVTISANALGGNRFDFIVLEVDYVAQTVRINTVEGTVIGSEPGLTQTEDVLWQIPLARITVPSPLTTISDSDIDDRRVFANIPDALAIPVTNDSAQISGKGQVFIWDTAATGLAVTTTTTENDRKVAGVWEQGVAISGTGRIIVHGICPVICDETVSAGDHLTCSTTAGQAKAFDQAAADHQRDGVFGIVLTANSGAGKACLAYINVVSRPDFNHAPGTQLTKSANQSYAGGAAVITFDGTNFDDFSWFDNANDRITVDKTGIYMITAKIFTSAVSIPNYAQLRVNGTYIPIAGSTRGMPTGTQGAEHAAFIWLKKLTSGDNVDFYLTYSGNNNVQPGTEITVIYLG